MGPLTLHKPDDTPRDAAVLGLYALLAWPVVIVLYLLVALPLAVLNGWRR